METNPKTGAVLITYWEQKCPDEVFLQTSLFGTESTDNVTYNSTHLLLYTNQK